MWAVPLLAALLSGAAAARTPKVGEPAPDFTLSLLDGTSVSLADLKGQVIILNFWALWCGPCRTELPLLDGYYALDKQFGLRVFAVDDPNDSTVSLHKLHAFLAGLHMPSARRIKGPYGAPDGFPTNYVIDRAGIVRLAKAGAFDLDALNAVLVPLLNEPAPKDALSPAPPPPATH